MTSNGFHPTTNKDSRYSSAFERLGIPQQAAPYLDLDREVRLYFGFLVTRSRCTEPYFHHDWHGLNNEAFTVVIPVTPNHSGFGLLYKKATGETAEYDYRADEAIMFGDNFEHSTKPGVADDPVILLSSSSSAPTRWHPLGAHLRPAQEAGDLFAPAGRSSFDTRDRERQFV